MKIQQHDGVVVDVGVTGRASPSTTKEEVELEKGRAAPGARGEAPMRLPTIYRREGGWFLALQVHWGVGKGGGKKSHHFPSSPIVIPPF